MTAPDPTTYRYASDGTLRVDCPHCPRAHGFVGYSPVEAVAMLADHCPDRGAPTGWIVTRVEVVEVDAYDPDRAVELVADGRGRTVDVDHTVEVAP